VEGGGLFGFDIVETFFTKKLLRLPKLELVEEGELFGFDINE